MTNSPSWGMACEDCGWKTYHSELAPETTMDEKMRVHQAMGCIAGMVPEWRFGQTAPSAAAVA